MRDKKHMRATSQGIYERGETSPKEKERREREKKKQNRGNPSSDVQSGRVKEIHAYVRNDRGDHLRLALHHQRHKVGCAIDVDLTHFGAAVSDWR
jgi:hypothetical protein